MQRWYVVHTQPRGEPLALANLENQGLETYLPRYLKRRRHARRTEWVPAPLFPNYLFVRFDVERTRWRAIHSTFGVRYLVSNGELPAPVPHGIVEEIQSCEDDAGIVVVSKQAPFDKGELVRIMTGALCDQVGLFDCATDNERVFILLDLLGRTVRVRVPLETVSSYA
ncbi:MAG: transcriptional activator RfaH [Rhodospirillales bacterium]|jgi:transcriptional antiterminator RfaH|nr:transcriptional activator RfaH [Rhodospirillales bacterium]MDP6883247.1 transcriptional activator RfaH [Rhodospirillales bacterium]